ncbi:UbiH/UbiF family hydroxylase [Aureimonas jatrophae]|nr:UbiH/UbiF family hydroxylase [Aureimonas jatrophae]MBB3953057.1 2-octaprenyl-6-methoxyphenol hydroxylase [Aureimonas jatrophae]
MIARISIGHAKLRIRCETSAKGMGIPMETRRDAVVVGGGLAGYAAALGLARAGLDTLLLAPGAQFDRRSTAIIGDSVEYLEGLGIPLRHLSNAQPLEAMRIIDDTRRLFRAPNVEFRASEIDLPSFGYNILNADLGDALRAAAERCTGTLEIRSEPAASIEISDAYATVRCGDASVRCRLLVGADGRKSSIRERSHISVREWAYPQTAIVLNFQHERTHDGTSTEFHTRTGPFTTVPLPGRRSSLVWVETPHVASEIENGTPAELSRMVEERMHSILGAVDVEEGWQAFPLQGAIAGRMTGPRVALVGEAAHVSPPIGAQGLNLGLRDAAALVAAAKRHRDDPGGNAMLADYEGQRRIDVTTRSAAVDWLNRSLLTDLLPIQAARTVALGIVGRSSLLRRALMREGVSPGSSLRFRIRDDQTATAV